MSPISMSTVDRPIMSPKVLKKPLKNQINSIASLGSLGSMSSQV